MSAENHLVTLLQKATVNDEFEHLSDSGLGSGNESCSNSNNLADALQQFTAHYEHERQFSMDFVPVLHCLIEQLRPTFNEYSRQKQHLYSLLLTSIRLLTRDGSLIETMMSDHLETLANQLNYFANRHQMFTDQNAIDGVLKELTNIVQKLSLKDTTVRQLIEFEVPRALVILLPIMDLSVVHCSLVSLTNIAEQPNGAVIVADLNTVENIVQILHEYDNQSKILAARLLCAISQEDQTREMMKICDGIAVVVSLLQQDNCKLQWYLLWSLAKLSADNELNSQLRQIGAIPILLSLITPPDNHEKDEASDSGLSLRGDLNCEISAKKIPVTGARDSPRSDTSFAVCSVLAELSLDYHSAQAIIQSNGLYLVGSLVTTVLGILDEEIADRRTKDNEEENGKVGSKSVLLAALRTLRFLFSIERNRRHFRRLLLPSIYEAFINVGHYNRNLQHYEVVLQSIRELSAEDQDRMKREIDALSHSRPALAVISNYAVTELLGSGAFGSVYRVKPMPSDQSDGGTPQQYALKEVNMLNAAFGKNQTEREKSFGDIVSELNMIREQLKHPNIVQYYRTFVENNKLYILMQLIDGAPLADHFGSLKEKGQHFSEDRIWYMFIQLVLAIKYLHKQRQIVHRDLTPNNVMLGEFDKITLTDFGLAKRRRPDASKLDSVVGTIHYSCPEIVQHQPYGEKADIWSLGCLIYQMAVLTPPFNTSNMLQLATRIVQAQYDPIPDELQYSDTLKLVINKCLTVDPEQRPDVLGIAALMTDQLIDFTEQVRTEKQQIQRKLEREQKLRFGAETVPTPPPAAIKAAQNNGPSATATSGLNVPPSPFSPQSSLNSAATDYNGSVISRLSSTSISIYATSSSAPSQQPSPSKPPAPEPDERRMLDLTSDVELESSSKESSWNSASFSVAKTNGQFSSNSSTAVTSPSAQLLPRPPRPGSGTERARRRLEFFEPSEHSLDGVAVADKAVPKKLYRSQSSNLEPRSRHSSSSQLVESALASVSSERHSAGVRPSSGYRSTTTGERKARPKSAQHLVTLSISPKKVRPMAHDPVLQMLNVLHKIIYITQLPPEKHPDSRRRLVDRFKRSLFSKTSSAPDLKAELRKVLSCSSELVPLNTSGLLLPAVTEPTGPDQGRTTTQPRTAWAWMGTSPTTFQSEVTNIDYAHLNYEQLNTLVEQLLREHQYY